VRISLIFFVLLCMNTAFSIEKPQFRLLDTSTIPNELHFDDLNNHGNIAGEIYFCSPEEYHPYIWKDENRNQKMELSEFHISAAVYSWWITEIVINDNDIVAFNVNDFPGTASSGEWYYWDDIEPRNVRDLYLENLDLNNNNELVAGFRLHISGNMNYELDGYYWKNGEEQWIPKLGDDLLKYPLFYGSDSSATSINDNSVVVGWSSTTKVLFASPHQRPTVLPGPEQAFIWKDLNHNSIPEKDELYNFGKSIPEYRENYATAINNEDMIVGYATEYIPPGETPKRLKKHPFLFHDKNHNSLTDENEFSFLPVSDDYSGYPTDINDDGIICGYIDNYIDPNVTENAVIWIDGIQFNLNECLSEKLDCELIYATKINNNHWIICHGLQIGDHGYEYKNFVLIPDRSSVDLYELYP
jgi:hypothetical protein